MSFSMLSYGYDSDSEIVDSIVRELGNEIQLVRAEQFRALKMILLNLCFKQGKKIGISQSHRMKPPAYMNPLRIGQRSIRTVISGLSPKYIKYAIGDVTKGKITTIQMMEELEIYLHVRGWSFGVVELKTNHASIILKDSSKDKSLIDFEDTVFTKSVRGSLKDYMQLLSKTVITHETNNDVMECNSQEVKRIFNKGSFQRGGRVVGPWAHLPSDKRKTISLDDEETVELDFTASTLNILYRVETGHGCPYSDPYPVVVHGVEVPKKYCKKLITISMNVGNASTASRVFREELSKASDLEGFDALGVSTKELLHAIEAKHAVVYKKFFQGSDYGLWLQFIESELVFSILKRLTLEGIPCLTVYDSFIVRKRDEAYVKKLMDERPDTEVERIVQSYPYQKITG